MNDDDGEVDDDDDFNADFFFYPGNDGDGDDLFPLIDLMLHLFAKEKMEKDKEEGENQQEHQSNASKTW